MDVKQHSTNQLYCLAANTFKADGSDRMRRGSEFRRCVKVEVAVLDSPSLISLMISVDVKTKAILSLNSDAQSSGDV